MPDGLTAALGQIRNRAEQITREHDPADCIADLGGTCTGHDAERLLAVADAVLELHQPGSIAIAGALCPRHENHRFFSISSTEAADVEACPDCPAAVYVTCTGCGDRACLVATVSLITAAGPADDDLTLQRAWIIPVEGAEMFAIAMTEQFGAPLESVSTVGAAVRSHQEHDESIYITDGDQTAGGTDA